MQEIRRGNVDDFDAVFALGLFCNHRLVIGIEAILVDAQICSELNVADEIHVERTADEFERRVVIECAATMFRTHVSRSAAANHTPTKRTLDFLFTDQHFEKLLSF